MRHSPARLQPHGDGPFDVARIALFYWWRHRRRLRLERPERFTEMVQQRKLVDRDPRLPMLADKVAVKAFVADRIGDAWLIPTLWHGDVLPDAPAWPVPFVVKARHGSNQTRFVLTGREDWGSIRRAAARWMRAPYGTVLNEWLYRHIPRGILVEPFVGEHGVLPIDYKLYVFGGRVACVQVHLGRGERHRWIVFDRQWRKISAATADPDPPPPANLRQMIDAAETLGRDIDFVRVDLYEIAGVPLFGEMTFYPGSGLDPFDPVSLDLHLGRVWRSVRVERGGKRARLATA